MTRTRPVNRHRSRAGSSPRLDPALLVELVGRLTPRDREVLELVWEHRVLTTAQLNAIIYPSLRRTQDRLLELFRLRALDRFRPWTPIGTAPWHWVLGPAGAYVLAGQRGIDLAELGYRRTAALAICTSGTLGHQIGVNEFFARLHAHARQRDDGTTVAHWWPERRCAALWGDLARPDAYGRWVAPPTPGQPPTAFDFFLEHDTGTETLARLEGKLAGYAELAETTGIETPALFWLPSQAREVNLRRLLDAPAAPVATAVHTPGTDPEGPGGPVWLPADSTGPRLRLAELAQVWPVGTGDSLARNQQNHRGSAEEHQDRDQPRPRTGSAGPEER